MQATGGPTLTMEAIMATNYVNDKLEHSHQEPSVERGRYSANDRLAGEIAQICTSELNTAGLSVKTGENLFSPFALRTKARGAE